MRKISLDVDKLKVESFETEGREEKRGTVQGYYSMFTCPQTMCGDHCESGPVPCENGNSLAWTDGYAVCRCRTQICVEL